MTFTTCKAGRMSAVSACQLCNTMTFESPDVCEDVLRGYGSRSYMKVIGSRSRSQQEKARNSLFSQYKTSICNDCGFDRVLKFASRMGFSAMADRMV